MFRRLKFLLPGLLAAVPGVLHYGEGVQLDSGLGRGGGAAACPLSDAAWSVPTVPPSRAARTEAPELRTAVYNLHSGLGPRWRFYASRVEVERNLRAIAGRIAATGPVDVVALNEVDFGSRRSGWLDQARFLADELSRRTGETYTVLRAETWRRDLPGLEVRFGNAALVRHPVLFSEACILGRSCGEIPAAFRSAAAGRLPGRLLDEPRGLLRIRIDFQGQPVEVLVTHLEAFWPARREAQAALLLERHLRRPEGTTLLLGDMNAVPAAMTRQRPHFAADRTHDVLAGGALLDARMVEAARLGDGDLVRWATFPAKQPLWPLDGIFATPDLTPLAVSTLGETESDHRGLLVHYGWSTAATEAAQRRWRAELHRSQLKRLAGCDGRLPDPARAGRLTWLSAHMESLDFSRDRSGVVMENPEFLSKP
jgi:endonuclease/exonuclease/phosphatase family metal-dependent hydrolase